MPGSRCGRTARSRPALGKLTFLPDACRLVTGLHVTVEAWRGPACFLWDALGQWPGSSGRRSLRLELGLGSGAEEAPGFETQGPTGALGLWDSNIFVSFREKRKKNT